MQSPLNEIQIVGRPMRRPKPQRQWSDQDWQQEYEGLVEAYEKNKMLDCLKFRTWQEYRNYRLFDYD